MFDNWIRALADCDGTGLTDAGRIDALAGLERLKAAAAAAQARITVAFDESQRSGAGSQREYDELSRSVAAQVALARHDSPVAGQRHLGLAHALVREMPHTHAALTKGDVSEWRATVVVRETATLTRDQRTSVDAELADRLPTMGTRQIAAAARAAGYRLDPTSLLRRTRGADHDRRVTLRPAPDTMTFLTGFLPVAKGVAVHTALRRHAESLRSHGDGRTLGQLMADTLVARVTGLESPSTIPIEIQLVMTDRAMTSQDDEPARIPGYGPVPAVLARRLVRSADRAWVRRLYADTRSGQLVSMDRRRRRFEGSLRQLLVLRDDVCRMPWCGAPIRHLDHPVPVAEGGPTTDLNGQGLCEACNYAKQSRNWKAYVDGPEVTTTTPTGHRYTSRPPPVPGAA